MPPAPPKSAEVPDQPTVVTKKRRGRRPGSTVPRADPAAGDWIEGRLLVTGPAQAVAGFVADACGPGAPPWSVDYAGVEEDAFRLALRVPSGRRSLSAEGCRLLARQFREAVEMHRAAADALVNGCSSGGTRRPFCPLDLHALLPVPAPILRLGRAHPDAEDWLRANWGATELRRVTRVDNPPIGRRLAAGHAKVAFSFWALGGRGPDPTRWASRYSDVVFRLDP